MIRRSFHHEGHCYAAAVPEALFMSDGHLYMPPHAYEGALISPAIENAAARGCRHILQQACIVYEEEHSGLIIRRYITRPIPARFLVAKSFFHTPLVGVGRHATQEAL